MGSRVALAAAFTATLVWSSSYTVARVGLRHFDPFDLTALRILTAAVTLSLVAIRLRVGIPARGDRWWVFASGVVGMTVYWSVLNLGLEVVESATTAFLLGLSPVMVAVMSLGIAGERLTEWGWAGLLAAFAGLVLVVLGQGEGVRLGVSAMLVVMAAAAHAAYMVMTKRLMSRYRPMQVVTWAMWSATITVLPLIIRVMPQLATVPGEALFSFLYLGIGSSALGFALWARALVDAPASVVASALYATPPLAALFGWSVLGERPGPWVLAGGVVILAAVTVVIRKGVAPHDPLGRRAAARR